MDGHGDLKEWDGGGVMLFVCREDLYCGKGLEVGVGVGQREGKKRSWLRSSVENGCGRLKGIWLAVLMVVMVLEFG